MKKIISCVLIFLSVNLISEGNSNGFFEGTLELVPKGCEKKRNCKVKFDLTYTDPFNVVWKADANLITDGASIPKWAQPVIGDPYDPRFIKPAVIHDHYCEIEHRVRGWRETHKMFYYALLNQGVDVVKAKAMYAAVYIGGPKWRTIIKGKNCGNNCVNIMNDLKLSTQANRQTLNEDEKRSKEFNKIKEFIESTKGNISIIEVEKLIDLEFPEDEFYNNPDLSDETDFNFKKSK